MEMTPYSRAGGYHKERARKLGSTKSTQIYIYLEVA